MVPQPARATFPHLADFSAAIGSGYVIEGRRSADCSSRISRERLGWQRLSDNGYGRRTGSRWKAFGASTDSLHDRIDAHTMVAAANATFAAFAGRIAVGR